MNKQTLIAISVSVLGTFAGIIACELFLRIAHISYPVFDTYDPSRGVALYPGKEGWYTNEGKAYLKINSLGYRDVEHSPNKPTNTFRIAVIGDSFTEARQVDFNNTYWSLLAEHLKSCESLQKKNIEVLNFGIGGYATTEELLTLQKDVLRFSPDLVLLGFYAGNDVQNNFGPLNQLDDSKISAPLYTLTSDGRLQPDETYSVPLWKRALYVGIHHSKILELLAHVRRVWIAKQMLTPPARPKASAERVVASEVFIPPINPSWDQAWLVTEALVEKIHQEVKNVGASFAVLMITVPMQVFPDEKTIENSQKSLGTPDLFYPEHRMENLGRKAGFLVKTLAEQMQKIALKEKIFFHGFTNTAMGIGHWNENGHRTAARLLAPDLCASLNAK